MRHGLLAECARLQRLGRRRLVLRDRVLQRGANPLWRIVRRYDDRGGQLWSVRARLLGPRRRFSHLRGGRVRLVFTVTDNGIGLSQAELKQLFKPYAQASADVAQRYGGAGLGLTISRRIIEGHGGRLSVQSEPGRGSTFTFTIPLASTRQDS